ncbi:MAG TPA: S8 family serine peptidase, partial [Solirubrobacteraceae bacterium]|nr:S8 family serine peptidase [Solirubrobacteraceae bacterium]
HVARPAAHRLIAARVLRVMPPVRVIRLCTAGLVLAAVLAVAPGAAHAQPERTGRLLVMLDEPQATSPAAARAAAGVLREGVRRDGAQVPQIGLVSVRPAGGQTLSALARLLRRRPGVRSVEVERRHSLRYVPDDPALAAPEGAPGTPAGTPLAGWVARANLPVAWDIARGDGAKVAVIDTGVDGAHPDIAGKIVAAVDNDSTPGNGGATADENGHGTHVASLACGAGNNAAGSVGAGLNCELIVIKTDLSEGSVARSIVQAADLGADAVNMSFGMEGGQSASQAVAEAVDYAVGKDVVLVAAASNAPVEQQGDPANLLQPSGTGANLAAGRGLTVTAANFDGARAAFAGRGSQISLAAFGSFSDYRGGPPGIFAAFPGNPTELERGEGGLLFPSAGCRCRAALGGDARYAYIEGTSMAAPMVAGVAAMMSRLNPDAIVPEIVRALKESAARPAGSGWNADLGWGVLDAAAALNAVRAIDRRPPASRLTGRTRIRRARAITLRWSGTDPAPPGLLPSGVALYEVYRSVDRRPYRRIKRTRARRLKVKVRPGSRYRYYTVAVDRAGNREAVPRKPDLSVRVGRGRGGR